MIRFFAFLGWCLTAAAQSSIPAGNTKPAGTASLETSEIEAFEKYPAPVKRLLGNALALTKLNLKYKYGSATPAGGGMDCSGTIYYLLRESGIKDVPRTASDQYVWARKAGTFEAVISRNPGGFEFDALRPGDLLFWTGTYAVERDPPVTHTMIYLGKRKKGGKPVMVGASDGRTYDGRKIWGVSVFDFVLPKARTKSAAPGSVFIGYARIPGLEKIKTAME